MSRYCLVGIFVSFSSSGMLGVAKRIEHKQHLDNGSYTVDVKQ